jgi:DNA-binding beta-propeller fold protein YncE
MFQSVQALRNLYDHTHAQRRVPFRPVVTRAAGCLLAVFAVFSALLSAFAQNSTAGCLPYSANYPCIYVANSGTTATGSSVSVVNATTNSVIGSTIAVGDPRFIGTYGVAVTPSNALAYVAVLGAIDVIDSSTPNTPIRPIALPSQPSQIALSHDGAFLWVTEQGTGYATPNGRPSVQAIETTATPPNTPPVMHTVTEAPPNLVFHNPRAITFSLDGTTAYVPDSCGDYACIDVIDTSAYTLTSQISLFTSSFNTLPFNNASIAVTPDGSLICVSVQVGTSSGSPLYGVAFVRTGDQSILSILTFPHAPDSNVGLGITSDGTLYLATSDGIVLVNTTDQSYLELLPIGEGPTGIAVAPDGATLYVTNSGAPDTSNQTPPGISVIKGGILIKTIEGIGSNPKGIAIMPSLPPTIVTQPANQTIGSLQSATLSVTATGTPPLTYQWYQGQSGDNSAPISGANSSSYTTPAALTAATSYWVAVSNLVTSPLSINAQSTTAVIMPTLQAPVCNFDLSVTRSLLTFVASATCTDPQLEPLVTTLSWGTGPPDQTNSGSLVVTRTLAPAVVPYTVTVTSTDISQLTGSASLFLFLFPTMSVFAGQAAKVSINVPGQSSGTPISVSYQCTSVIDSNGTVSLPSALGISCVSTPSVITLGQSSQSVTIAIQTTGAATTIVQNVKHDDWTYAFLLPFSALLWLGAARRTTLARRTGYTCLLVVCGVILLLFTSCGGGFTSPPKVTQLSTPPGNYQITIKEVPSCPGGTCQNFTGFIQTTLIVPLTVSPTQ